MPAAWHHAHVPTPSTAAQRLSQTHRPRNTFCERWARGHCPHFRCPPLPSLTPPLARRRGGGGGRSPTIHSLSHHAPSPPIPPVPPIPRSPNGPNPFSPSFTRSPSKHPARPTRPASAVCIRVGPWHACRFFDNNSTAVLAADSLPSHSSESLFRVTLPSHSSESLFRVTLPSQSVDREVVAKGLLVAFGRRFSFS